MQPKCPKCSTLMTIAIDSTVYITDKKMKLQINGDISKVVRIFCASCSHYLDRDTVKNIVPEECINIVKKVAFEGV